MTTDEALKMASEALDTLMIEKGSIYQKALEACKEALETPECNPHPKAPHGFNRNASHSAGRYVCECEGWQLEWQGLSDDEIAKIIGKGAFYEWNDVEFAHAIEQALKEKNT